MVREFLELVYLRKLHVSTIMVFKNTFDDLTKIMISCTLLKATVGFVTWSRQRRHLNVHYFKTPSLSTTLCGSAFRLSYAIFAKAAFEFSSPSAAACI